MTSHPRKPTLSSFFGLQNILANDLNELANGVGVVLAQHQLQGHQSVFDLLQSYFYFRFLLAQALHYLVAGGIDTF